MEDFSAILLAIVLLIVGLILTKKIKIIIIIEVFEREHKNSQRWHGTEHN